MTAVCLYFQVHQPYRIRPYSFFDIGSRSDYFDESLNCSIMQRIARQCYLPTNKLLLKLIRQFKGAFKVSFSITGVAIEQMKLYAPEALESFRELASTAAVEFLGETYYHSLAALCNQREFEAQVRAHSELMQSEFGVTPTVFRNTELIYSDEIGKAVHVLGFSAALVEGADRVLGWRSPNQVYKAKDCPLKLLVKNYKLSDDIAFRFRHTTEDGGPLTVERYAQWIHALSDSAQCVGLFLDYETFGEHLHASTGIFDFLAELPSYILSRKEWRFVVPSEVVALAHVETELSYPQLTSWADSERDVSAWTGNDMQRGALRKLYELSDPLTAESLLDASSELQRTWRQLQTSDHFYYMSTKAGADGSVHRGFAPFESPYRAFIAYSNVLRDFAARVVERTSRVA
jgi:alpha-amylase